MNKLDFILKLTSGNKNAQFKWIDMQNALYDKFGYFSDSELSELMRAYDAYILGTNHSTSQEG